MADTISYLEHDDGLVLHNGLPVRWALGPSVSDFDYIVEFEDCYPTSGYLGWTHTSAGMASTGYFATMSGGVSSDPKLYVNKGTATPTLITDSANGFVNNRRVSINVPSSAGSNTYTRAVHSYKLDEMPSHYYIGWKWANGLGVPRDMAIHTHAVKTGKAKILKFRSNYNAEVALGASASNFTDIMNVSAPNYKKTSNPYAVIGDNKYSNTALTGIENFYTPRLSEPIFGQNQPLKRVVHLTAYNMTFPAGLEYGYDISGSYILDGNLGYRYLRFQGVNGHLEKVYCDTLISITGNNADVKDASAYKMDFSGRFASTDNIKCTSSHFTSVSGSINGIDNPVSAIFYGNNTCTGSMSTTHLSIGSNCILTAANINATSAWCSGGSRVDGISATKTFRGNSANIGKCYANTAYLTACSLHDDFTANVPVFYSGFSSNGHWVSAYDPVVRSASVSLNYHPMNSAAGMPSYMGNAGGTLNVSSEYNLSGLLYKQASSAKLNNAVNISMTGTADYSESTGTNTYRCDFPQLYGNSNYAVGTYTFDFSHVNFIQPTANVTATIYFSGRDYDSAATKNIYVKLPVTASGMSKLKFSKFWDNNRITIQYV